MKQEFLSLDSWGNVACKLLGVELMLKPIQKKKQNLLKKKNIGVFTLCTVIIQYVIFSVNSPVCPACIFGVFHDQMFWIVKSSCGWFKFCTKVHVGSMCNPLKLWYWNLSINAEAHGELLWYHCCQHFEELAFKLRCSNLQTQCTKSFLECTMMSIIILLQLTQYWL